MTLTTLSEAAARLQRGDCRSIDLVEAALARAEAPDGQGHHTFARLDRDGALAQAQASDLLRRAGLARSPLEGLPVSVKDLFDVQGQVTRAGSVVLADAAPASADAPAVARLRAAGAVIIGRTTMTEFAFSGLGLNPHQGTPLNPWDRPTGRIPGGSSSGAAVSVTDGMALGGIGSDTGGSVRIPAALCGLTGFKPTQRRVPREGVLPLSVSLDSIGPLAATVDDCALLDAVMAGEALPSTAVHALPGLRFLVPTTLALDDLEPEVAAAFERALRRLAEAGATIEERPIPAFAALAGLQSRGTLAGAEAHAWHRDLLERAADGYDPRVRVRIEAGARMCASDYVRLQQARRAWITQVEGLLGDHDALLMPTVPSIAPPLAPLLADDDLYARTNLRMLRNPTLVNFLDGAAWTLPCHRPGEEAPVGLMLAGPPGSDARLLPIARGIEACLRRSLRLD